MGKVGSRIKSSAGRAVHESFAQGRSDGGYIGIYTPLPKSAQVNFLWGKNDVRTAIQQFYTPKNFYTPKTNFWLPPWFCFSILLAEGSLSPYQKSSMVEPLFWGMVQPWLTMVKHGQSYG